MARKLTENEEEQTLVETTPDNTTPVEFAPTLEAQDDEDKEEDKDTSEEKEAESRFGDRYDIKSVTVYGKIVNVSATAKNDSTPVILSYTKE